jgi:hypothetical protein
LQKPPHALLNLPAKAGPDAATVKHATRHKVFSFVTRAP